MRCFKIYAANDIKKCESHNTSSFPPLPPLTNKLSPAISREYYLIRVTIRISHRSSKLLFEVNTFESKSAKEEKCSNACETDEKEKEEGAKMFKFLLRNMQNSL